MTKLKKELKFMDVFAICTGAMVSSGLFVLPGIAFNTAGPAVILAYMLAGFLYIPAILSYAELSTAMPRSGGSYFFVDRSLGPILGTIGGISEWLSMIFKSSFALIGMGAFVNIIYPNLTGFQMSAVAAGFCIFFVLLNIKGVKEAGLFQKVFVVGLLGILVLYVVNGFSHMNPSYYEPFIPHGHFSIFTTAGLVYISFAGINAVANVGEEVIDPGKNIPLGMISAFVTVMIAYTLAVLVTVGIVPGEQLAGSLNPLVDGASISMGAPGKILVSLAAIFAFVTTANAGVMSASRIPASMSRDGHLPSFFMKINQKLKTPVNSIIVTGLIMVVLLLTLDIEIFVKTASAVMLLLYILVCFSVIVMRESKIYNYKPIFVSPLYPYIQIAGAVAYLAMFFTIGVKPILIATAFIAAGLIWHFVYARIQINRESALVRVMERFMDTKYDRDLTKGRLGAELRDIIKERDEIVEDHFDRMVKEAKILDLEENVTMDEFFRLASSTFAKKLNIDEEFIYNKLIEHEKETTSEIYPGLALPHVITEEECKFSMLIARSKSGIVFDPAQPPVHVIFMFIGSKDMRPFYLRSLVAVTEITRQSEFFEYWMNARDAIELKNIILTGERNRVHLIYCLHCSEEVLFEDELLNKISTDAYTPEHEHENKENKE